MPDGSLAANWFVETEARLEAYDANIAISRDGGRTWSKPVVPHRDRNQVQHGFVSMLPVPGGRLSAIWLDGRSTIDKDDGGEMSLMYTTIGMDGTVGPETVLDGRACECCQVSVAPTPDGMVVAYRDRSQDEIRDISIVRLSSGRWSPPQPVAKDGWEIYGCPVNGPAISSSGTNLAVAWFTGVNDEPRLKAALSSDAGTTFGPPIRVDDGNPVGRVDIVALPSKEALVSWVERTGQGPQVRVRVVKPDGTRGPTVGVSGTASVRTGGIPRMKRAGDEVLIAWTDAGSPPKVRTAVLKLR
jgi:hypothetical protein